MTSPDREGYDRVRAQVKVLRDVALAELRLAEDRCAYIMASRRRGEADAFDEVLDRLDREFGSLPQEDLASGGPTQAVGTSDAPSGGELRERMIEALHELDRVTPHPLTKEELADAALAAMEEGK